MKPGRRDLWWIVLIAVSFAAGLAVSWERWGNPLVDCGREMNQPLRLARGELLYGEVRHIYGPLSPHLNALLFNLFGPSLGVLYADGIITAAIIIALVYWVSRRIMEPAPAAAGALSVMWLCAFKQAGNYILPYSFSALHGCALGMVTLAIVVKFVKSGRTLLLPFAGVAAGLAVLAKTEMGIAALAVGIVGASLAACPSWRRGAFLTAIFLAPAVALTGAVYSWAALHVGWRALTHDSYLLFTNLPPELVYFNMRMSGFDRPLDSLFQMASAFVKLGLLAALVAAVTLIIAKRPRRRRVTTLATADAGRISLVHLWSIAAVSMAAFLAVTFATGMQLDRGPYLAMPILLVAQLSVGVVHFIRNGKDNQRNLVLIVVAVYALASLARVMLRVRSGGAYSSYLMPASVILFTYAATYSFAGLFRDALVGRLARRIVVGLILVWLVATAIVFGVRYRRDNNYPISTARGTIIAVPEMGKAFMAAIEFLERETVPGEPVAVIPEGTSLNFFTDRPHPLRDDILMPGMLDREAEEHAIRKLIDSKTQFVLLANRPTPEFGAAVIGRDYYTRLMGWIEENFEACAIFAERPDPALEVGSKTFFIKAFKKKRVDEISAGPPTATGT